MAEEEKKRFLDGNDMELGERQGKFSPPRTPAPQVHRPTSSDWQNNPILPVISYCASSILMTVANKYILSFPDYNLNFFLLAVQVCPLYRGCRRRRLIPTVHCLHCRDSVMQDRRLDHLPRLQSRRGKEMYVYTKNAHKSCTDSVRVPHFPPTDWHDLHQHESPPFPVDPRLHNLQELDNYPDRLR